MKLIGKRFKNERLGIALDVYEIDGKEWFRAKDISDFLGYRESKDMVRIISFEENINRHIMPNVVNPRGTLFINEFALYEIVCKINKTDSERYNKARDFQKWIYEDVLPSIRKDGAYIDTKNITESQLIALQNEITVLQGVILTGLRGSQKAISTVSATIFNGNRATLKMKLVEEGFISEDEKTVYISHVKRKDGSKIPILLKKEFQNEKDEKIKTTHKIKVTGLGEVYFMYHFGLVKNDPQFRR